MTEYTTREAYLAQGYEVVVGTPERPETCRKRFLETGLWFGEVTIDSGKGGEPLELVQITDMHFNAFAPEDESNEELMLTRQHRSWNANGASERSAKTAMDYAKLCDKIIVTGDTWDFLSNGAAEMMERLVWDVSDRVVACIGGHELVRMMQTGEPDRTPLAERLAIVASRWHNDIHYHSEIIGGKAMIILLDNSRTRYLDCQIERFKADLAKAREAKLPVLIFQHEPLATGNPADRELVPFHVCSHKMLDFYDHPGFIGAPSRDTDEATARMLELIKGNCDLIRGIFCGHRHSAFYSEVLCEGGRIPQYVLEGNVYDGQAGHIMRITVK